MSGTLVAPSREALADQLKRIGYLVTQSEEIGDTTNNRGWLPLGKRVKHSDLMLFSVQLSKLVLVGIPLVSALNTLTQQIENSRLKTTVFDVIKRVESGSNFSQALEQHPAIFPGIFSSMVRAGEISGKLDVILKRFSEFMKREADLRRRLQTAVTYPATVFGISILITIFLLTGIIPKFMHIFKESNVDLPLPTLWLHYLSLFLMQYWWLIVIALSSGYIALRYYISTSRGRQWFDQAVFSVPLIGNLIQKAAVSRMCRTLETLLSSGVPVLEALLIAGKTSGSTVIEASMQKSYDSVKRGGTIADPLKLDKLFPPMVVQMINVGESSGTVDYMLGEVADHFDDMLEQNLERLVTLVEPICLVFLGSIVAGIMASIMLPLFQLINIV